MQIKLKRSRPTSKPVPSHIIISSNCFSTITKGSNRTALQVKNSERTKVEKLVNISSPSTLQRAASCERQTSDYPVAPLGRPKKKQEELKKALFLSTDCKSKQQDLGFSNSQTNILFRDIRLGSGSEKVIEKNAFIMIQEKNHQLDTFFELSKLVYCLEEKETKIIKNVGISNNSMF